MSKNKISLLEETATVSREISLGHNSSRGGLRMSTSSANQCQGLKGSSDILGNVPRSSVGADMYCSDIR